VANSISKLSAEQPQIVRSEKLSFGAGGVEVLIVETLDENNKPSSVFYPSDTLKIRVICLSHIETDNLNVAVRIRNKEGIKMYSWGTLNQDMQTIATGKNEPLFWKRKIKAGQQFEVILESECGLGENLYEIQAAVSYEGSSDYLNQRLLHWRDEAAFFQVLMKRGEYFFGGVIDMQMRAEW
jgi:lipopolysaccharide transport system ATP-binding protein